MQRLLFILILLTNFLLINSHRCLIPTKKVSLIFYYYPGPPYGIVQRPTIAYIIPKYQVDYVYFLTGNQTSKNTLHILNIQCSSGNYVNDCLSKFRSLYISLEHIIDDDCIMKLEDKDSQIKGIIHSLSLNKNYNRSNLTCTIKYIDDASKHSDGNFLTGTSLFSIIFIGSCIVLACVLLIAWFALVYYRRFEQYRIKKQQQNALENSVKKILDKSPIIIFNSTNKNNYFIDDDPMCAVCLEPFIDNEKLRKLVCSHYFHIVCIDPWLMVHQSCPLCNRNILNDSVPSISARITSTNDELNNRESESIDPPIVVNNNSIIIF